MKPDYSSFQELDLGSAPPTPVGFETVQVKMKSTYLKDYATAFVREAERVDPLWFRLNAEKGGGLTEEEMAWYASYLLEKRIESTTPQGTKDWRRLKALWIPGFLQYALSTIGIVYNRQKGFKFEPVYDDSLSDYPEIDQLIEKAIHKDKSAERRTDSSLDRAIRDAKYERALEISDKLAWFEGKLQVFRDAMPRGIEGDYDVMTSAIIANYVCNLDHVEHPIATYVAALLDATLLRETAFSVLYRVQYDDVTFIIDALTHSKSIFAS